MLIRSLHDVDLEPVQMDGAEGASMAVMIGKADGAPSFSMRQFEVAPGGYTPRHSHDYEHEVIVLSGRGEVLLDGDYRPIKAGDVVFVPADEEHQFRVVGAEPFRFVCLVPGTRNCGEPTPGS
ncbi:MAG: cupin domain-containing protein [Planctomycetota bacterium]